MYVDIKSLDEIPSPLLLLIPVKWKRQRGSMFYLGSYNILEVEFLSPYQILIDPVIYIYESLIIAGM